MEFVRNDCNDGEDGLVEVAENIWIAASDGDILQVEAFLLKGVPVNAQDETGYSPM
jgi:hypothetical protein